ncbi:hypothetical protein ACZ90_24905 [Streptomyces albus subsp. albus]|nr:hypothetical protein ACZ90_24905 [Streptomyces albus subsp. albus]
MPARHSLTCKAAAAALLLCTGVLAGYSVPERGPRLLRAAERLGGGPGAPGPDVPEGGIGPGGGPGAAAAGDHVDGAPPRGGGPGAADGGTGGAAPGAGRTGRGAPGTAAGPLSRVPPGLSGQTARTGAPAPLPGLGPGTAAKVPAKARQALLVSGVGRDSDRATAVLFQHTRAGWRPGPVWPAHNALRGWTDDHHLGDLRSPRGVFTLSDAGGLRPDPGSRLPYDHSGGFVATGLGFEGEPLTGAFDYVVAIDYNRVPGTSPLDRQRPMGPERGGGIWIHVDHGGPTHGCVSLSEAHMKELLRALDPALRPVIVMGDRGYLLR